MGVWYLSTAFFLTVYLDLLKDNSKESINVLHVFFFGQKREGVWFTCNLARIVVYQRTELPQLFRSFMDVIP